VPRRRGGHRTRRTIPGIRHRLITYYERNNAAWGACRWGKPCRSCDELTALRAETEPRAYTGEIVWAALFNPVRPRLWDEFMHDPQVWQLLPGTDSLELGDPTAQNTR
jgi:hypothetical protein